VKVDSLKQIISLRPCIDHLSSLLMLGMHGSLRTYSFLHEIHYVELNMYVIVNSENEETVE
jgi:hypothetical protein